MAEYSRPTSSLTAEDVRRQLEPRTWRFWSAWAVCRLIVMALFVWWGTSAGFWFVVGAILPEILWFLKDEALKREKMTRLNLMAGYEVVLKDHVAMYQTLQGLRDVTKQFSARGRIH